MQGQRPKGKTFGFHGLFHLPDFTAPDNLRAFLEKVPDDIPYGRDAHDLCQRLLKRGDGVSLACATRIFRLVNKVPALGLPALSAVGSEISPRPTRSVFHLIELPNFRPLGFASTSEPRSSQTAEFTRLLYRHLTKLTRTRSQAAAFRIWPKTRRGRMEPCSPTRKALVSKARLMRLKTHEKNAILRHTSRYAAGGEAYLFGSRVNPESRGGDIDLLLLTDTKLPLRRVRELRRAILSDIGEQKLDIVNFAKQTEDAFKDIALQGSVKL